MKKHPVFSLLCTLVLCFSLAMPAYAAEGGETIQNSKIYTGFVDLISDLTTAGMIICPAAGALFALYYFIRRGMADEQDGKLWTKRIVTSLVCGVGGLLVSGIISLLTSYFI